MSFNNLSVLDVSYDNKAYGNLIDPYEWNTNFKKIEEIFNQNKEIIEGNFGLINATNTPSEAIEALGQTLPSNVRDQLLLIVSLLLTKADNSTVDSSISGLLKEAVLDQNTGIVTFTKYDGSTFSIDFATEKIPARFELIEEDNSVYLQITNMDDTYTRTNVTALLNVYTFNNGNDIEFVVDGYDVSAHIKAGSLTTSHMSTELIQYFDNAVTQTTANALATESAKNEAISARDSAKSSADEAKVSENNSESNKQSSEVNATLSKSYAVGGTGTRTNEDTDNAEYYMLQTKRLKEEAEEIVGGDYATKNYVEEHMQTAETNANTYTDKKVATAETNANTYTDQEISKIPTPDVSGQIATHNTSSTAHEDIRTIANNALEGLNEKAPIEHTHDDRYYTKTQTDAEIDGVKTFIAVYGTTTYAEITEAITAGKTVLLDYAGTHRLQLTYNIEGQYKFTGFVDNTVNMYCAVYTSSGWALYSTAFAPAYTYGTTDLTAGTSPLATGALHFVYK